MRTPYNKADKRQSQSVLPTTHLSAQVDDLLDVAAAGEIGDGPGSFLLSLEVSLDEDIDQRLQTVGINHGLDLDGVAGGDVGDGPGALL